MAIGFQLLTDTKHNQKSFSWSYDDIHDQLRLPSNSKAEVFSVCQLHHCDASSSITAFPLLSTTAKKKQLSCAVASTVLYFFCNRLLRVETSTGLYNRVTTLVAVLSASRSLVLHKVLADQNASYFGLSDLDSKNLRKSFI